jgi:predicted TPR repeat methyltransferase
MSKPGSSSYRDSHRCKGADYQARFEENPRRALLWSVEQLLLERILRRFLPGRSIDHLDFACGTGRVLGFLEGRTRTSTGVDVSPSMLAVARDRTHHAELVEGDLTRGDVLGDRRFDLITAFRFFPNAEEELRRDAIGALTARLSEGGILVFNNHRNLSSLLFRLARLRRPGADGNAGMGEREVESLVAGAGLAICARYHAGIVPESEPRVLRPRALVAAVERLATRLPLAGLSEDVIYVCRRAEAVAGPGR